MINQKGDLTYDQSEIGNICADHFSQFSGAWVEGGNPYYEVTLQGKYLTIHQQEEIMKPFSDEEIKQSMIRIE